MLDIAVQNADETIERFADRVLQMTRLGYPSVSEQHKIFMAIYHFVRGCTSPCTLFEVTSYPDNFDEAVSLVIHESSYKSLFKWKVETSKHEVQTVNNKNWKHKSIRNNTHKLWREKKGR